MKKDQVYKEVDHILENGAIAYREALATALTNYILKLFKQRKVKT